MADNFAYRHSQGYKENAMIGWEKEVGWRPIQYLDRFENEHGRYSTNMFVYAQVVVGKDTLDDCEVVAWDMYGNVVGNQTPEPIIDGDASDYVHNLVNMACFGDAGDPIHFTVVLGTKEGELKEYEVTDTIPFVANTIRGYVDTDGDGWEDALQPLIFHLKGLEEDVVTDVKDVAPDLTDAKETEIFNLSGMRLQKLHKGINIVLSSDGKVGKGRVRAKKYFIR